MIKETNAVFQVDDDDVGLEGRVFVEKLVDPNQGNILADEDNPIIQKIKDLMKYIDPDKPDPFNPANFCKDDMQFIEKTKSCTEEQPPFILTQIDLMRILMHSGCSLLMFDLITKWVKNYSKKKVTGNLWIDYGMESRDKFLKTTSSIFDIERHKPRNRDVVVTHFDKRKIPVPTFDFVSAVTPLLHNDNAMAEENIIEGYDTTTGETDGCYFWSQQLYNLWTWTMFPPQLTRLASWERSQPDTYTRKLCRDYVHRPIMFPSQSKFSMIKQTWTETVDLHLPHLFSH